MLSLTKTSYILHLFTAAEYFKSKAFIPKMSPRGEPALPRNLQSSVRAGDVSGSVWKAAALRGALSSFKQSANLYSGGAPPGGGVTCVNSTVFDFPSCFGSGRVGEEGGQKRKSMQTTKLAEL